MEIKERNYLWDNMKCLLIFLVVAGHLIEGFRPIEHPLAEYFDFWIYSFHMPAFIFVSGYLAKNYCKDSRVRPEKIVVFVVYYAIFQVLLALVKFICQVDLEGTSFFDPERGLWYLLAMIFYYLIIPVAEKLAPYLTVGALMVLSIMIGMEPSADTMMSVHRIFTFAPFFFIGYYFSVDAFNRFRSIRFSLRIGIGIGLMVVSVLIWVLHGIDNIPINVFYGKDNYLRLDTDFLYGSFIRLEATVIGLLMIFGLLAVMPAKKSIFSVVGQRSLSVYLFHMPIVVVLMDTDLLLNRTISRWYELVIIIAASVFIVAVLSLPVFIYPFKWIQTAVNKIMRT